MVGSKGCGGEGESRGGGGETHYESERQRKRSKARDEAEGGHWQAQRDRRGERGEEEMRSRDEGLYGTAGVKWWTYVSLPNQLCDSARQDGRGTSRPVLNERW